MASIETKVQIGAQVWTMVEPAGPVSQVQKGVICKVCDPYMA